MNAPPSRRWLREPLVHFLAVGALLFAIDALRSGTAPATPAPRAARPAAAEDRHIVLDGEVRAGIVERWRTTMGVEPTAAQIERELDRWRDEEILYREGLRLGLDRGDPAVRERVARKMAQAVGAQAVVPEPTEDELRAWFDQHPERWARPAAIDFTHVFVAGNDAAARARADELHGRLVEGAEPARLGDTFQGGRRYRRRKLEDLAQTFGDRFADGLRAATVGGWQVVESRFGWHVVRLDARIAAEVPTFDAIRADVRKDWQDERRRALQEAAMGELRARWTVVGP